MKRILGYAAALLASLSLAGVAATSARADGDAANAASGQNTRILNDNPTGDANSSSPANDNANASAPSSSSSSAAESSSVNKPQKPAKKPGKKPAKKPAKKVTSAKKMRGRLHYRKDSRKVLFQKGRKGAKVVLRNAKGQFVKKFDVKHNGKFILKLSRKEALKLGKYRKHFTFTVAEKGYKAYTVRYLIYK